MTPILSVRSLGVRFGGLQAVKDIDFDLEEGRIFGLLGPNGAGKTTLFNLIAGACLPTAGSVTFAGQDITRRSALSRARGGIARTFQITRPFPHLSVLENVVIGTMMHHRHMPTMRRKAEEILDYVGLAAKRDMFADGLSTGQRKRLELARALATEPKLLLMDEVTGGVDQPSIPGLVELVASLRARGMSIVLIEHNMSIMAKLCDRMLFMDRGEKMSEGTPAEVLNDPQVARIYLGSELSCSR